MKGMLVFYIVAIDLAAVAAAVSMPREGLAERATVLIALAGLALLTGSRSVRIPGTHVELTPGDVFTFSALPAVGPLGAMIVAFAGTAGAMWIGSSRPRPLQAAFNLGAVPLAAAAGGAVWQALPTMEPAGFAGGAVALLAAAVTFSASNSLLLALVLRLQGKAALVSFWARSIVFSSGSTLLSVLAAAGLTTLIAVTGPMGLVLGLFVSSELARAYSSRDFALPGLRT